MAKFLVVLISAVMSVVIAIFSVQNATPVPVTFLNARTVALPVGIWVAIALFIGMLGTTLLLSLFRRKNQKVL